MVFALYTTHHYHPNFAKLFLSSLPSDLSCAAELVIVGALAGFRNYMVVNDPQKAIKARESRGRQDF